MKRIIFILNFIMLFTDHIHPQFIDKPIFEIEKEFYTHLFLRTNRGYDSDTSIDVIYYKLNLTVNYEPNLLAGSVTINSVSRVSNLSSVFYDFRDNMSVDSILYSGNPVSFLHSQNKIDVSLPDTLGISDLISIEIFYHGIPDPTGFGSFEFGSHNGNEPSIWTLSEPYGASDWFPCKNVPSDKADSSDVIVTCSKNLIPVSNGTLKSVQNNSNGTHTYSWHNSYPIANYLISLAISNFAQYNFHFKYSPTDSMPVVNYIYPEDLNSTIPFLDKTSTMLSLFSDLFGLYPFVTEKYGHAQFGGQGAMEHQTISSMGVFNESIMAHELAHQWFGDKITCRDWQNIWLNEGFATFCEALYAEHVYGKTDYNDFIRSRMSNAKTATGTIYVQDVNSIGQIFSGNRSYAKGCTVLHMLRGITGDSIFFRIMKSYATDTSFAYGTAVTEDFRRVAENISQLNLEYFFNEWIYGENYPKYNVGWTTEALSGNQYKATINILQDVNTFPQFFSMPIQIKIITQRGDTVFHIFNNAQSQNFEFILNSQPLDFKVDPDNWILKDVRGENVVPVNFVLNQNFPNPFNPKTTINFQLGKPSSVSIKVYDVLGKEIQTLFNDRLREGNYNIDFYSANLASGVYFYTIEARDFENVNVLFSETKRMVIVK